jgi:hypothetical protein
MGTNLRFDRGARYGAGLVATCVGAYLGSATDFSAIVQSENYAGTIRTDIPLVNVAQFVLIVGVFWFAFAILPTPPARRVAAVTLASVVFFMWATLGLQRGAGQISEPVGLWSFILDQGFVTLLVTVGGWAVARDRHPLSWLAGLVCIAPPIVAPLLVAANFTTGGTTLVMQSLVIAGGVGGAWLAAAIDRPLSRLTRTFPPAPADPGIPAEG